MLTKHAAKRMRQRGLPPSVIDLLYYVGCFEHVGPGIELVYLDRSGRAAARGLLNDLNIPDSVLDAYLVCDSDGRILTIGHRYNPVKHH